MAIPMKDSALRSSAETSTVEDLVRLVRRGEVRVPRFQRGLRWQVEDVVQLFDSIYRGYPIGSFLLSKNMAEAGRIKVGILAIDAPETNSALWVVDGQQRLTALTVSLSRPVPIPTLPDDPWVIYFDSKSQDFYTPSKGDILPTTWVPVAQLLDASTLSEWIHNWRHAGDAVLRKRVFEAGARIRQYRIPLYIVESAEEQLLRDIFHRVNNYGKSLKWKEVHDALFGKGSAHPSTLVDLATELFKLDIGRPDEELLLQCLLAYKGLDVTRNVNVHYRKNPDVLKNAVEDALPTLRSTFSFLKIHAEIPHIRLLAHVTPVPVLTRFYALYPDPKPRSIELLVRWTWRTLLSASFYDDRTLLRHGINAFVDSDEEKSIQTLLQLVPRKQPSEFMIPTRFDARAADSRVALLGMASLKPIGLGNEKPIDTATLIDTQKEFRNILRSKPGLARGPANRILLPGHGIARQEIVSFIKLLGTDSPVLHSHAISDAAAVALVNDQDDIFLEERQNELKKVVTPMITRLTGWDRSDRPSISYLLGQAGDEE